MRIVRVALPLFVLAVCPACVQAQQFFDPFFQPFSPVPTSQSTAPSIEDRVVREADAAYKAGNYSRVEQLANELILSSPESATGLHLRASARIELGRKSGSKQQLRNGIEDSRQALSRAGKTHAWLYIPYMYGMTTLAEVEKKPAHAQAALTALRPVLARSDLKDEEKSQLRFQAGLANLAAGNPTAAIREFQTTLKIDPRHMAANVKLAQTQVAQGDAKGALATLDKAVEMLPRVALVFNERGMLRRSAGRLDEAVDDFSTAIRLDPKFAVAVINRGVTLMDLNSPQPAEIDFDNAIRLQPQNVMLKQMRAAARVVQGEFEMAIADYTAVSKANPAEVLPIHERGFARFYKRDFAGAAADFEWSYGRQPQWMYLVPWQALSLMRAGQAEAGLKLLDPILEKPSTETNWIGQICAFLAGKIDEETLLKGTVDAEGKPVSTMLCEAHFFIGQKRLLADDAAGANEHFDEAVATKVHHMAAHRAARFETARK